MIHAPAPLSTLRRRLQAAIAVLCACVSPACSSWHVETLPAPTTAPIQVVGPLRITLRSDTVIDLTHVTLTRDSLIGMTDPTDWTRRGRPQERLAFARRDVVEARTSSPSRKKTAIVAATVSLLAAIAYALSLPIGAGD